MLKSLFGRKKASAKNETPVSYDDARDALENRRTDDMTALAASKETPPEMLYYLAQNGEAQQRLLVAQNTATPLQADHVLAQDETEEVRAELARKIARLVPDLTAEEQSSLRDQMVTILDQLARDQAPRVRQILAEELKQAGNVPRDLVRTLADDSVVDVCAPVLEYSPLLNDDDLKEIIAAGSVSGALSAIARRSHVSEGVADALVDTFDAPSVAALLANPSAQIREETLDAIIDGAQALETLHEPLAMRASLSVRAVRRIAGFVAASLVSKMVEQQDLPEAEADTILSRVRDRIASEPIDKAESDRLAEEAVALAARGEIDDAFVMDRLETNERERLLHCLAAVAKLDVKIVRRIIMAKSGRAVTALAWKAGLSMRTAYALQKLLALVPPTLQVVPKDGHAFPLAEDELAWQLEAISA